jgi:methylenetetrahydrofolate--tRNA-(uracil-5-)-methyltransferase
MKDFQPMKANFGILPSLDPPIKNKRQRYENYAKRARNDLSSYLLNAAF